MINQPITCPPIKYDEEGNVILEKQREIKFGKNFHPEFKGYVTEEGDGIWISIIEAKEIGKGHFSNLIKEFKEKYSFIKIPTPSKMIIKRAIHLDFKLKREYFASPYNDYGDILLWELIQSPISQTPTSSKHNISLKDNSNELSQISSNDKTSLNKNIPRLHPNFEIGSLARRNSK